jgi:hypothetical protein
VQQSPLAMRSSTTCSVQDGGGGRAASVPGSNQMKGARPPARNDIMGTARAASGARWSRLAAAQCHADGTTTTTSCPEGERRGRPHPGRATEDGVRNSAHHHLSSLPPLESVSRVGQGLEQRSWSRPLGRVPSKLIGSAHAQQCHPPVERGSLTFPPGWMWDKAG